MLAFALLLPPSLCCHQKSHVEAALFRGACDNCTIPIDCPQPSTGHAPRPGRVQAAAAYGVCFSGAGGVRIPPHTSPAALLHHHLRARVAQPAVVPAREEGKGRLHQEVPARGGGAFDAAIGGVYRCGGGAACAALLRVGCGCSPGAFAGALEGVS
jgi:hypothetical protein